MGKAHREDTRKESETIIKNLRDSVSGTDSSSSNSSDWEEEEEESKVDKLYIYIYILQILKYE